jgi:hypothetical protein
MPAQSTYSAIHRRRSSVPISPTVEVSDPWLPEQGVHLADGLL